MSSENSKNGNARKWQAAAKLYDRLRQLHLEIADVYAELAAAKPFQGAEKVVPINSKSGKLLANLSLADNKARVEIVSHLPTDNAPYTWLKNYLKSTAEKDQTFRFRLHEDGQILKSIEIEGNITQDKARKLESALRWSFNRMDEESSTPSKEPEPASRDGRAQMQKHSPQAAQEGQSNA